MLFIIIIKLLLQHDSVNLKIVETFFLLLLITLIMSLHFFPIYNQSFVNLNMSL